MNQIDTMKAEIVELQADRDAIYDRLCAIEGRKRDNLPAPDGQLLPLRDLICAHFDMTTGQLTGAAQQQQQCRPRMAFALIGHELGYSQSAIGRAVNRDHTSIRNSLKRGAALLEADEGFAECVQAVRKGVER